MNYISILKIIKGTSTGVRHGLERPVGGPSHLCSESLGERVCEQRLGLDPSSAVFYVARISEEGLEYLG